MKISLDALQVIDAISRNGSFAGAADELDRVPSAITYTVQKLEQDLGVKLFDRSGHRARLTDAGQELLREGRYLLRAANDLECRVQRVATGWEAELRMALDDIVPVERLFPLLKAFYREGSATRIRLLSEILGGCWDALLSGRADLAIATGEPPREGTVAIERLGDFEFVFAVAPDHPLAGAPEPISANDLAAHRAVPAADTSRNHPPRSTGLIDGQDTLTVPTMRAKLSAQIAGLGIGYLPARWAEPHIKAGRLVIKQVEGSKPPASVHLAWHPRQAGRAAQWFLARLREPQTRAYLLGESGSP